ncbi:MAG: TolC family protein [Polyangiales bacterium]
MRHPLFVTTFAALLGTGVVHAQGVLSPTKPLPGGGVSTQIPTVAVPPIPTASGVPPATTTTSVMSPTPTVNAAGAGAAAPPSSAAASAAKTEKPKGAIYDLAKCLALADARSPTLRQAKDRLAQAHAQLDEITWVPWSQWTVSGGAALVPEIRGTSVYSPNGDISISSKLGPAWRVGVEGVIPIWTFGKISAATASATALVDVALADVDKTRTLVRHDVRRAYFGLELAHDARYLLELAQGKLDDAVKKAEGNDDLDEADVLRMKTYQLEVKARLGEVEKGERMATAALRFLIGVEAPTPLDIPEDPIAPPRKPLTDVLVYLKRARLNRPELRQVKAGVKGYEAQLDLAKARLWPDIGLGLSFGYANSPIITDQTNPFVVDGANYLRYGVGLVFRWNLDLLPGAARVRYAEAKLAEIRDLEAYALGGVGVEVENAWATAKDAATRVKFYGDAEQIAKKWVATVSAGIAVGTREDKDIIDPLRSYLTNRYAYLQAVMDLDVALSSLAVATGDDAVAEY